MVMNKPLALLLASVAASSMATANAASLSTQDTKARQQMVQSTTEAAVDTNGGRATAWQDAQNVALSRQFGLPGGAQQRAAEQAAAVYPQSGPAMAALSANNTALSKQLPSQGFRLGTPEADRFMEEAATP
jgi:hypothetical protein